MTNPNITPEQTTPDAPLFPPAPRGRVWLISSLLSWPLAFFYVRYSIFEGLPWARVLFTLLFVTAIELFCYRQHREAPRESRFWAVCLLLISGCFFLGLETAQASLYSLFFWHIFAIWYALCRTGMLAQRKTGSLVFFDGLSGCIILPFENFILRDKIFFAWLRDILRKKTKRSAKQIVLFCISLFFAFLFCAFAWSQLAAADDIFAGWGENFFSLWDTLFQPLPFAWTISLIFAIPVGAWLYGLIGGGLNRSKPVFSPGVIQENIRGCQVLPAFSGWLVFASLSGVYALFFIAQILTCVRALSTPGFTAVDACELAVQGFWQLCGIMVLNLAVLLLWKLFSRPEEGGKALKRMILVFCCFGILFALLGALRLGIYTLGFGITSRRIIAGWWVSVLLVWAVSSALRLFRDFPAVRYGLYYAAASCVACCYLLALFPG